MVLRICDEVRCKHSHGFQPSNMFLVLVPPATSFMKTANSRRLCVCVCAHVFLSCFWLGNHAVQFMSLLPLQSYSRRLPQGSVNCTAPGSAAGAGHATRLLRGGRFLGEVENCMLCFFGSSTEAS